IQNMLPNRFKRLFAGVSFVMTLNMYAPSLNMDVPPLNMGATSLNMHALSLNMDAPSPDIGVISFLSKLHLDHLIVIYFSLDISPQVFLLGEHHWSSCPRNSKFSAISSSGIGANPVSPANSLTWFSTYCAKSSTSAFSFA